MKQVYTIGENSRINLILDETYDDLLAAVRHRNPGATQLIDDKELFKLHYILALLRLGHIKLEWAEGERGRFMVFEVS